MSGELRSKQSDGSPEEHGHAACPGSRHHVRDERRCASAIQEGDQDGYGGRHKRADGDRLESEFPAAKTMAEQGVQPQQIRTRRDARNRICGVYVLGRQAVVFDEFLAQ